MLAPSLGEAWPSWSPKVISPIVHDATLPLGWPSLGDRCPGCVTGGKCLRCVTGRPQAYFAISISDFEVFFSLADDVIVVSASYYVDISGKVCELVPIPGYFVYGYIRYPGKY